MRKISVILFLISLFFLFPTISHAQETKDIIGITQDAGYQIDPITKPKASIVVNASNGDILWQDNMMAVRDPASMSKMFTLYLLFEDIDKGKLDLDTTIRATETDQAISQIYEISNNKIVAGVDYPVSDLITMTAVPSSNAATIMLANYLSENNASAFIDRINMTAEKLGMSNTHFNNASGAVAEAFNGYYSPDKYDASAPNQTTAHDLAILAYNFLKKYPDILSFTNQSTVKTMIGTPYEEEFHSYNYSLPGDKYGLKGVDGLKTGSSPSAAFNAMVTAQRDGQRLITIVMGVGDWSDQEGEFYRHPYINALTEKGFEDINKTSKTKFDNLFPKEKKITEADESRSSSVKVKKPSEPGFLSRFEAFVDHHHGIFFIGLGIFIVIVIILALVAIL